VQHAINTRGWVLDDKPGAQNTSDAIFLAIVPIESGQTGSLPSGLNDPPSLGPKLSANDQGCMELDDTTEFTDYLVFQPAGGGVWVEIAEAGPFSISGIAQWTPFWPGGTLSTSSLSSGGIASGNPTLGFVSWDDYFTDFKWNSPFV